MLVVSFRLLSSAVRYRFQSSLKPQFTPTALWVRPVLRVVVVHSSFVGVDVGSLCSCASFLSLLSLLFVGVGGGSLVGSLLEILAMRDESICHKPPNLVYRFVHVLVIIAVDDVDVDVDVGVSSCFLAVVSPLVCCWMSLMMMLLQRRGRN